MEVLKLIIDWWWVIAIVALLIAVRKPLGVLINLIFSRFKSIEPKQRNKQEGGDNDGKKKI